MFVSIIFFLCDCDYTESCTQARAYYFYDFDALSRKMLADETGDFSRKIT